VETQDYSTWNIRSYGATGDRQTNDQEVIQKAIDACHEAGGGTVVCPAGDYLTGTLHLKDHVTLYLESGATLWGSTDQSDYDVPHLIYAKNARNFAILGPGAIDGQGEAFWVRDGARWRVGEFRPGKLLHFEECQNIRMHDFTITNAPGWTVHIFRCDDVVISGLTIINDPYGPNTDGIDPNCSTNVHISNCHIVAGDDCIVLKATESYPCENITVTNCTLETTCAALKLGTESHGNIRHCTFTNCTIRNTSAAITLYAKDGGVLENVLFSDITIEMASSLIYQSRDWPIFMDLERRNPDSETGAIRDVTLRNLVIQTGGRCIVQGMASHPLERITLDNITLKIVGFEDLSSVKKPRGGRTSWNDPEGGAHVAAPAHFVFSNVKGLKLRNVDLVVETEDGLQERSAVFADAVEDIRIEGFQGRQSVIGGTSPALHLHNCGNVFITSSRASADTGTFLRLDGSETAHVTLMGNDLASVTQPVSAGDEVPDGVLFETANRMP